MMAKDKTVLSRQANSQPTALGFTSVAPPILNMCTNGQSVENVQYSSLPSKENLPMHWYVVRATRGRAQQIYNEVLSLNIPNLEIYLPSIHREEFLIEDGLPNKKVTLEPLHNGLLFVRTTRDEFTKLVHAEEPYPCIKGLTPYYDHFRRYETGGNAYLVVPDKQFYSFRKIIESGDVHILVDQDKMPTYLNGRKVEIMSGPFAGVSGKMIRWKGLRRVFVKLDQIGTVATGFVRTCDFRLLEE